MLCRTAPRSVLDTGETITTKVSDLRKQGLAVFGASPERVRETTITFNTGQRLTIEFPGEDKG
jgi:hypothetical protein